MVVWLVVRARSERAGIDPLGAEPPGNPAVLPRGADVYLRRTPCWGYPRAGFLVHVAARSTLGVGN